MTHLTLPSEVEPESLAELVADCRSLRHPAAADPASGAGRAGHPDGSGAPVGRAGVTIPESTAALLDGMPDYGD